MKVTLETRQSKRIRQSRDSRLASCDEMILNKEKQHLAIQILTGMKQTVQATIILLFCGIFFTLTDTAEAQLQPEQIDTLFHAQVGPGMFHTEYEIRSVPWRIQVLQMDTESQQMEFRTVKANNRLSGLQRPSEMKDELENDSVYVVAGVNGDFYGTGGVPVNAQVVDGTLLKRPFPRELIAFDDQFQPFIETTTFSGEVSAGDSQLTVDGINESRGENQLTIYNSYFGPSTGTNAFGTEIGVRWMDPPAINRPGKVVIEAIETGEGDMAIEPHDLILSGHGTVSEVLENFEVNDTLDVELSLNPLDRIILEAVGGSTQFIKNGVVDSNWEERHPRTAVGFSADTTQMYFVVVDGRQSSSAGMMLSELGDFLVELGVDHAINLDGGGSSAMVIQDDVVNNPSDGGLQRSVANALFVTMPNPGTGSLQGIQIKPGFKSLFIGKNVDLNVYQFDEFYRRELVDTSDVQFTVDESIGTVSNMGKFTAGFEPAEGYIYAEYDKYIDSTRIEVLGVEELRLNPRESSIDTTMTFSPSLSIKDSDGLTQNLSRNRIEWSLTRDDIGNIDDEGMFIPSSTGSVGIVGSVGNAADTVWVNVQQLDGYNKLTDFSDTDFWGVTTENLPLENVSISEMEDGGLEIQYTLPSQDERAEIHLSGSLSTEGVPESANIENSGDGQDYILFVDIANPEGGLYRIGPQRLANHTEPEVMEFLFDSSWANRITPGASYYFPFSLEAFVLQLPKNDSGEEMQGYFRFHQAGVVYSETGVSTEEPGYGESPESVSLKQNYPNPFNPTTDIQFSIPERMNVKLEVFDLIGRRVALLVDGTRSPGTHQVTFDASNLASGAYLYRLQSETTTITKSMMLIK